MVTDPVITGLRADARRPVLELARILARHASWQDMTTWRPRALVCEEIGSSRDPSKPLSISAYKRARQVLEERGFLCLAAPAWTSSLRAGVLDDGTGTCAVYVLTVPCRKQRRSADGDSSAVNGPVTGFRRKPGKAPRAREAETKIKDEAARAPRGQSVLPRPGAFPLGASPQTRSEALGAAQALQERARLYQRLSAEHMRSLCRPFFAAGWLPRDVLHAVDHSPVGRRHGFTAGVRSPGGWIRARLTEWLGPDGTPLPSRSQRLTEDRRQVLADQAARRAQAAAARAAAATDYRTAAAQAREMLRTRPRRPGVVTS
ncbi:MAG: hypothetical protein ABSF03_33020 [Streptosporangiaceae bacterium]